MTVTTTHDPNGGGMPRLLFSRTERSHHLLPGMTSVGSDPSNDLCLEGLAAFHAQIHRNEADDYVLVNLGSVHSTRVHGRPVHSAELHTGARIELGEWVLSFARAEFADHGRPNGGRQGGESWWGSPIGA
jgi:pSer/pThr/pTyr-binding forkhead associated (FHA) protein